MQKRFKNDNENTQNENEKTNQNGFFLGPTFYYNITLTIISPHAKRMTNPVSDVADEVLTKKLKFGFLLKTMIVKEIPEPSRRTSIDELMDYVCTLSVTPSAIAAFASIDPKHFWLRNGDKYPKLGQLALDIILAPASEAYAERVFSHCGL